MLQGRNAPGTVDLATSTIWHSGEKKKRSRLEFFAIYPISLKPISTFWLESNLGNNLLSGGRKYEDRFNIQGVQKELLGPHLSKTVSEYGTQLLPPL